MNLQIPTNSFFSAVARVLCSTGVILHLCTKAALFFLRKKSDCIVAHNLEKKLLLLLREVLWHVCGTEINPKSSQDTKETLRNIVAESGSEGGTLALRLPRLLSCACYIDLCT